MYTLTDLNDELRRLFREIDDAQKLLEMSNHDYAVAENEYRKKKATVFIETEGTVERRKAAVDLASEKERLACHIAEGIKEAALEKNRNLRVQLSCLQTLAMGMRAEIELAGRPEPDHRPSYKADQNRAPF